MRRLALFVALLPSIAVAQVQIQGSAVQIGGNQPGVSSIQGQTGDFTFTGAGFAGCSTVADVTTCTWNGGTGTIGGSGTVSFIPLWTLDGTTLGNSHIGELVSGTTNVTQQLTDNSATASTPAGIDNNTATSQGPIFGRIMLCPNTSSTSPGSPWKAGCVLNMGSGDAVTGPDTDGAQISMQWNNYGSASLNRGALAMSTSSPRAQAIQWDLNGNVWFPVKTNIGCLGTDAAGKIGAGTGCGGTPAVPGGTNGQIQFNSSGSFGGDTGSTTDGAGNVTTKTLSTTGTVAGQGGTWDATEGTAPTGAAGHDLIYADATTHQPLKNPNTTGAKALVGTSATAATSGHCAQYAANGYDIADAGAACGAGAGTVTSVSVTTANGVSGSVATATTTPAITLTLGAITPTSVVPSTPIAHANIASTAVTPGSYTNANITVAADGSVTAAANGSAGGSGLSGQTTNYLPKAASATTSTSSSIVEDQGTGIVVHSTGTAYGAIFPEGTALTPTAGTEIVNSNSTSHTLDLSVNGGAFSPICTVATCGTALGIPLRKQYTFVADSTATSVTTPSITVVSGDFIAASCRFGTGTTCAITSSCSSYSWTALTAQLAALIGGGEQLSWAVAPASASCTYTATQSGSAAGISIVVLDYSGTGSTVNTTAFGTVNSAVSSKATSAFTTSQRTLLIHCAAIGALVGVTPGVVGDRYGAIAGVSQSAISATNADQGCTDNIIPVALTGVTSNFIITGSTGAIASSLLAVNY